MSIMVTGSPVMAMVDAFRTRAVADATLAALVTGVYGYLPGQQRTAYPYVVLGSRSRQNDSGAMQKVGGHVALQVDIWSDHKGPSEVETIQSRLMFLFERHDLQVSAYAPVQGSLTCEFEDVTDEPDEDSPDRRLYHGVQRWVCEIHES